MKKLFFTLLLIVILSTCKTKFDPLWAFPEIPDLGLQTTQDVMLWVACYITYQSDTIHYPANEYWQSPAQTYVWGCGDCEDFTILAMYLLHRDVGLEPRMVRGTWGGRSHAWVLAGGNWWEPQEGITVTDNPDYVKKNTLSYEEVMERATTSHRAIVIDQGEEK